MARLAKCKHITLREYVRWHSPTKHFCTRGGAEGVVNPFAKASSDRATSEGSSDRARERSSE